MALSVTPKRKNELAEPIQSTRFIDMSRLPIFIFGLLFCAIGSLIGTSEPAQSKEEVIKCYDEEALAENSEQLLPGYMLGEVQLENQDKAHFPFAQFVVRYEPISGIAHLKSQDRTHEPKHDESNGRRLPDWADRISFYKEGAGWNKLTLEDAKKIFGNPQIRGNDKTLFYSFEAFVTVQRERQLFH